MKKLLLSACAVLFTIVLNAQQIPMYGYYFYKPMVYNPAFTGTSDATNAMILSRSQWANFNGAPQLNIATIDGSLKNKKLGLGLMLISDKRGLVNRIGGDVLYSNRFKINEESHFLFGISLGVVDQTIDYSKAFVESSNDPTLFKNNQRKTVFEGNVGLAYVWKGLECGFAVPQLFENKIKYVDTANVRGVYAQVRHFMGSAKYKFPISDESKGMSLTPLALVRYIPGTPFQFDANLNFDWKDKFWVGATYKSDYAVGANVGFVIYKQLSVGYSYDFIMGSLSSYSGTAQEIMVNFKFVTKKEAPPVVEEDKTLENEAYVSRMDSLQMQLKELSEKLAQQAKIPPPAPVVPVVVPNNDNQNSQIEKIGRNTTTENGVLIVTAEKKEFADLKGKRPDLGYYVIIGTYFYRELAVAEANRFLAKGYTSTSWVYSGPKSYNYIFMFKCATKEEAFEKIKIARNAGVSDAWLQRIIEDK